MDFRVYRNSGRTPPCEEAEKREIAITETVHCRTPEEYDRKKKNIFLLGCLSERITEQIKTDIFVAIWKR